VAADDHNPHAGVASILLIPHGRRSSTAANASAVPYSSAVAARCRGVAVGCCTRTIRSTPETVMAPCVPSAPPTSIQSPTIVPRNNLPRSAMNSAYSSAIAPTSAAGWPEAITYTRKPTRYAQPMSPRMPHQLV
jgi:hypothetical protein